MAKAMDLLMWELEISDREKMRPILFDLAADLEPKHGVSCGGCPSGALRAEMDRFADVYNSAWRDNWGFVPYSKKDLDYYAGELRLVYDKPWFMVAERGGETVAMAITVPDINQVLRKMRGRILPFGWWHYLRRKKIVDRVRVGFLGVKPEYQHTGRRRGAVRRALRRVRALADQMGRDGLDPRDEPRHEPWDAGHERAHRQALPRLRARACRRVIRARE